MKTSIGGSTYHDSLESSEMPGEKGTKSGHFLLKDMKQLLLHLLIRLIIPHAVQSASCITDSPVFGLLIHMQNGVRGISHMNWVNSSLDLKNHQGAYPPRSHELRTIILIDSVRVMKSLEFSISTYTSGQYSGILATTHRCRRCNTSI